MGANVLFLFILIFAKAILATVSGGILCECNAKKSMYEPGTRLRSYKQLVAELKTLSFVPQNMVLEGIGPDHLSQLPKEFFVMMTERQMKDLMLSYVTAFRDLRLGNLTPYREALASAFSSVNMRGYVTAADLNMIGYDIFIPLKDLELDLLQALIDRWSNEPKLTAVIEKELKMVVLPDIEENPEFNSLEFTPIFFSKVAMVNPPANWPEEIKKKAKSIGVNMASLQMGAGVPMDVHDSVVQSYRTVEGQRAKNKLKEKSRSKSNQNRALSRKLSVSKAGSNQGPLPSILKKSSQLNMQNEILKEVKRSMRRRSTISDSKKTIKKAAESSDEDEKSDSDNDPDYDTSDSTETIDDDSDEKKKKKKKSTKNKKKKSERSKKDKKKKSKKKKQESDTESSDSDLEEFKRKLRKKNARRRKAKKTKSHRHKGHTRTVNGKTDMGDSFHNVYLPQDN
jgi:hypothetical protein